MTPKVNWFWASAAIVLLLTVVVGAIIAWSRYSDAATVEISLAHAQSRGDQSQGDLILISGDVSVPGVYPLSGTDTIAELLQAAGGPAAGDTSADVRLELRYGAIGDEAQRININRADVWLLEALPGIGETLARRIVDYRKENGAFRSVSELSKVSGIGAATYEAIEGLITVSD